MDTFPWFIVSTLVAIVALALAAVPRLHWWFVKLLLFIAALVAGNVALMQIPVGATWLRLLINAAALTLMVFIAWRSDDSGNKLLGRIFLAIAIIYWIGGFIALGATMDESAVTTLLGIIRAPLWPIARIFGFEH